MSRRAGLTRVPVVVINGPLAAHYEAMDARWAAAGYFRMTIPTLTPDEARADAIAAEMRSVQAEYDRRMGALRREMGEINTRVAAQCAAAREGGA